MKKLIALAILAMALPITVSAATKATGHQTIPSLLSGRVTVEEQEQPQETTGFAMETPEVWYEEPVEIADNSSDSSTSSSSNNSDSSSEPAAEEPAPEPTPTPAPEPEPVVEPTQTYDCEYCGGSHATYEEYVNCAQYTVGAPCDKCDHVSHTTEEMLQHMCQAHSEHIANGAEWICEYCGNTILPDGHVDDSNVVME